ncbi:MAG: transcriptional repressor NrdR [Planctomycetes bacterium]|nr:transcriptional repressor NrdR [Planctomycetota bacterium]
MRCPFCKANNDRVIDSRGSGEGAVIRRRRQCLACMRRFTTYERVEENPFRVIKKDGSREPFSRAKILNGLLKACEKRPVPMADLEEIVNRIELDIYENFDREVPSKHIGDLVMNELRGIDQVAYVRFASVYREFKDLTEFMAELQPMLGGPPK